MINQSIEGNRTLTNGTIVIHGSTGLAIENYNQHLVIRNVYIKSRDLILSDTKYGSLSIIEGSETAWSRIHNYAFAPKYKGGRINVDNIEHGEVSVASEWFDAITLESPPSDIIDRHTFPQNVASWQDDNIVNIVSDYGATPYDHTDDDSPRIQQAINDVSNPTHEHYGKSVFIPRGHFYIDNQIIIKRGVTLFGASKSISVLHVSTSFDVEDYKAIIETEDGDANNVIHDFAILKQDASASLSLEHYKN